MIADTLASRIQEYKNTAEGNDALFTELACLTDSYSFLKCHRDLIEENQWGFGDRAFHYLWKLIFQDLAPSLRCLEIGVYKGQTISLWALLSRELGIQSEITAVTPLHGLKAQSITTHRLKRVLSKSYRAASREGNLYDDVDYLRVIQEVFHANGLDFNKISLLKGSSQDDGILKRLSSETFDVIYIDGDHSFEGARKDMIAYAPLIRIGGYLVVDDASYFLPGTKFWKGHEAVSRACEVVMEMGFKNVINVGHNRVFQKIV